MLFLHLEARLLMLLNITEKPTKEQEQLFSHTRPNGSDWWTVDSTCCYGECLSKGYNENEVTMAWMNSPTHKSVIMDSGYKTAGIGYYVSNGVCYIALETGY